MKNISNKSGFSLMEVMLSLVVFSLVSIVLLISLSQTLRRQALTTQENHNAAMFQQTVEYLQAMAQSSTDWDLLEITGAEKYISPDGIGGWTISSTAPTDVDTYASVSIVPAQRYDADGDGSDRDDELDASQCVATPADCYADSSDTFKQATIIVYQAGEEVLRNTIVLTLAAEVTQATQAIADGDPDVLPAPQVIPSIIPLTDDAEYTISTANNNTSGNVLTIESGKWVGLRFANIAIPAKSTILKAEILGLLSQDFTGTPSFQLTGHVDSNPLSSNFATQIGKCSPRNCLATSVLSEGIDIDGVTWSQNTWFPIADFSSQIQELVNGATWPASNIADMSFLIEGQSAAPQIKIYAQEYDVTGNSKARLQLAYATPTPTPTPTVPSLPYGLATDGISCNQSCTSINPLSICTDVGSTFPPTDHLYMMTDYSVPSSSTYSIPGTTTADYCAWVAPASTATVVYKINCDCNFPTPTPTPTSVASTPTPIVATPTPSICTAIGTCPITQGCNLSSGQCQPNYCNNDSECTLPNICNRSIHTCTPAAVTCQATSCSFDPSLYCNPYTLSCDPLVGAPCEFDTDCSAAMFTCNTSLGTPLCE